MPGALRSRKIKREEEDEDEEEEEKKKEKKERKKERKKKIWCANTAILPHTSVHRCFSVWNICSAELSSMFKIRSAVPPRDDNASFNLSLVHCLILA